MQSISNTTAINPVVAAIIEKHPARLSLVECGAIIGLSREASYVARSRGQFPVRVRSDHGRLFVFTSDLVTYLTDGILQCEQSCKPLRKRCSVQTGRPTKRETWDAQSRGLTVKELREQTSQASE